jgi:hypothetical protein
MVSTVSARPNHYETLGLKPTASAGEIAQAFARSLSMFRPRAMGGVAEVSIAYETLRDPTKRRAYDASLGLAREPETVQWPVPAAARFIGSAPADPVARPVARPQSPPEPRLGSFIAESLREPAAPEPEPQRPPEAQPKVEQRIPAFVAADETAAPDVGSRAIEWKRPAIAASALILGVALLGAWAGMSAGGAEEPQPAGPGVTVAVPQAKPPAQVAAPAPAPGPVRRAIAAQPVLPIAAKVAAVRTERTAPPPPADTQVVESAASPPAESTTEVAAAQAPPAEAVAANLPLPNKVIARTIERIGYACGEVSSIASGEASGVYKVTCTSGQSYQAKPVNGRYRFRRLGSH